MGKTVGSAFGCAFIVPLGLAFAFVIMFMMMVEAAKEALPVWAQGNVDAWIMGTPQPLYAGDLGSGISMTAGVSPGWLGYTDTLDTNPPEGLPLAGIPQYGCTFQDPNYSDHVGVDFPVGEGTPVYTTMTGKVIWAGEDTWADGAWGNLVIIENNGYQIWLAHLSEIDVSPGDIVEFGDQVGLSGDTGNSTGPHLHYGVRQRGQNGAGDVWLNPELFFGDAEFIIVGCSEE